MKRGRKTPGRKTINQREDFRAKLFYAQRGSSDYLLVQLRELIGDGSTLSDNFLSADYLSTDTKELQEQEKALRQKIATFWRRLCAQFERAVLDGNANWFTRQADAIKRGDRRTDAEKDRGRFETEVYRLLTIDLVPERKILACFVQHTDTQPLTETEKREIRELEQRYNHAVVEDLIGKSYMRNDDGELIAVSKGDGALILEWTVRWTVRETVHERRYSCRFKNRRCARDTVRSIAGLRPR